MNLLSRICALLVLVLAMAAFNPTADAGPLLVQNGGFEILASGNTLAANGGYFCQTGTTCTSNVANWTSGCRNSGCGNGSTPASLIVGGTGGSAFNGNIGLWADGTTGTATNVPVPDSPAGGNYIAFDGDANYNTFISQSISGLVSGQSYVLTFYQGAAQQKSTTGATTEQWQVSLGSQTQTSTQMSNVTKGWVPWQLQTMTFVADNTTDVLKFLAQGTPTGLPPVVLLDGITLVQAPEPATFALIGLGLIGIPLLSRRLSRRRAFATTQNSRTAPC